MTDGEVLFYTEIVKTIGILISGIFSVLAVYFSAKAVRTSSANSVDIKEIKKATDGLTSARVEAEIKLGAANAQVERGAGRDEERARGEMRAAAVAEGQKMTADALVSAPVDVKVVETTPVEVKKSVPIKLEK